MTLFIMCFPDLGKIINILNLTVFNDSFGGHNTPVWQLFTFRTPNLSTHHFLHLMVAFKKSDVTMVCLPCMCHWHSHDRFGGGLLGDISIWHSKHI